MLQDAEGLLRKKLSAFDQTIQDKLKGAKTGGDPPSSKRSNRSVRSGGSGSNDSRSSKAGKKKATTSGHPSQGR